MGWPFIVSEGFRYKKGNVLYIYKSSCWFPSSTFGPVCFHRWWVAQVGFMGRNTGRNTCKGGPDYTHCCSSPPVTVVAKGLRTSLLQWSSSSVSTILVSLTTWVRFQVRESDVRWQIVTRDLSYRFTCVRTGRESLYTVSLTSLPTELGPGFWVRSKRKNEMSLV